MTKPLEQQIAEFKLQFELAKKASASKDSRGWIPSDVSRELRGQGWKGRFWNWDPEWDGLLLDRVWAIQEVGLEVSRFYRKQKIHFKIPKGMTRPAVVERIVEAVGHDWVGLTFNKSGGSVWWKGGGPWKTL